MELSERGSEIEEIERQETLTSSHCGFCDGILISPSSGRVAVTVMEYSVRSSRPVSVYIVSLPAMSGMVLEPGIHSAAE